MSVRELRAGPASLQLTPLGGCDVPLQQERVQLQLDGGSAYFLLFSVLDDEIAHTQVHYKY